MADFKRGERVIVSSTRKDPGGTGEITGIDTFEDDVGAITYKYRVLIPGSKEQEQAATDAGRPNRGFWYARARLTPA